MVKRHSLQSSASLRAVGGGPLQKLVLDVLDTEVCERCGGVVWLSGWVAVVWSVLSCCYDVVIAVLRWGFDC